MLNKSNPLLINCDMGEWDAPHLNPCDEVIMPLVNLCNIACGGHAGTKQIIQKTLDLATENNVKVGAHPSYEDRQNFGRKYIPIAQSELIITITKQIELFLSICSERNVTANHVKAHGALYHACNNNKKEAEVLITVVSKLCPDLTIFVGPESELEKMARSVGLKIMTESFIDRRYNDDLSLVSRKEAGAVIQNVMDAKKQYKTLSLGKITTQSGKIRELKTHTACIHGDNPQCVQILKSIRANG